MPIGLVSGAGSGGTLTGSAVACDTGDGAGRACNLHDEDFGGDSTGCVGILGVDVGVRPTCSGPPPDIGEGPLCDLEVGSVPCVAVAPEGV